MAEFKTDRRCDSRIRPEGPISVRILSPGHLSEGLLVDLNSEGAFLATDLTLDAGTRIGLDISLPGDLAPRPRTLQAVVARHTNEVRQKERVLPAGLGVRFLADTEEDREYIRQMIKVTLTFDLLSSSKRRPKPPGRETIPYGRPFYRIEPEPDS